MASKPTSARGVRLPIELWARLDSEAASLNMTRNEYLSRKLSRLFPAATEHRKMGNNDHFPDEAMKETVDLPA